MTLEEIRNILTDEQYQGFELIVKSINENRNMYLLKGVAGSGKTTLISMVMRYYNVKHPDKIIACTATTNKAVKVIKDKVNIIHNSVLYSTVHKQLKLKEKIVNGNQLFIADFSNLHNEIIPSIVFVDEASMISNLAPKINNVQGISLWENLLEFAMKGNVKFIFIGDFAQIPPVGEEICILNKPETIKKHKIEVYELNNVVRQAAGSPIIQLASYVRNHQNYKILQYDYQDVHTSQGNVSIWPRNNQKAILKKIQELVTDLQYSLNSDFTRCITWSRASGTNLNKAIRIMIFGEEAKRYKYIIGEKLIANKPIFIKDVLSNDMKVVFTTSDEFTIVDYTVGVSQGEKPDGSDTFNCYYLTVRSDFDGTIIENVPAMHESSEDHYNSYVNNIKKIASETHNNALWKWYYRFIERFADVSYAYSITAHKAQGSTFIHCNVVENDIYKNWKVLERNQILYTAYTRPSHSLNLIR